MLEKLFQISFSKITDKNTALKIIKAVAYMQFFAAGLMLIGAFSFNTEDRRRARFP